MAQPQSTTEQIITDVGETETTLFLTRTYSYRKHTVHIENKTQTVILRCDFDGSPKPAEIEWAFNGNTLKKDALLTAVRTRNEPAAVLEYEYDVGLEWEFPREKLTLANQLGAGAFGNVVFAVAEGLLFEGVDTPVAVKMLKDEHTDDDVKDLVCEMEIMKKIGNHPNVISLLGSCTRNGPLFVIVEYAAHGNLKSFLEDHRSESTTTLTTNQLVSFASQIASGMQHLSSMKLIHRDLAARNILVSEGLVMKIADFGLARDVHNQEYYRKMTSGKLPIRWMAPESLEERFFNTKTDVWSFGVLLWEIMTLGRDPYQFVADWQSFLEYLKQGHRLEQPTNCPDEIYQLMEACWEFNPENRPTFEQISAVLENTRLGNNLDVESGECLD
ncbi:fibroblast growth factor receptor homolog 1 [Culex quinquefasciatus]|uniref:fibroblast growth factor receptor homolog 1 n=1 Tax=Culex quinquefasciatus TaxID=7176 RepID=UPI0018E3C00A|nr:fibroblast growth factor receptor homolog 1 [Culex quinquefasciatus]